MSDATVAWKLVRGPHIEKDIL